MVGQHIIVQSARGYMKESNVPTILSIISMIVLLIGSYFCFLKINKNVTEIKTTNGARIVTTTSAGASMNVNLLDATNEINKELGFSDAYINVYYESVNNEPVHLELVLNCASAYEKTSGVDGINSLEYTYEIIKDDKILTEETQFDSFNSGDVIVLGKDSTTDLNNNYHIILRFYSNMYDQSHLIGTSFNGIVSVKVKE